MRNVYLIVVCVFACHIISSAQEPLDFSRAKVYSQVWSMPHYSGNTPMTYTKNFGGKVGLDILTTVRRPGGVLERVTWLTRPRLDTHNIFNWNGINNPGILRPIDYDGVPPLEYVNLSNVVWRCNTVDNPFPMIPIDTIKGCFTAQPLTSVDVDGDGYLDVLMDIGGAEYTAGIILGGPQAGKGCARVRMIPSAPSAYNTRTNWAFYRTSRGGWRLIQEDGQRAEGDFFVNVFDVKIDRVGDSLKTSFLKLGTFASKNKNDSNNFGVMTVIVDTVAKHEYLLLNYTLSADSYDRGVQSFDITNGTFDPIGSATSQCTILNNSSYHLGTELGFEKPVYVMPAGAKYILCHPDDILHPIGQYDTKVKSIEEGYEMFWEVINDQTGDGLPDILTCTTNSQGKMRLISSDPNATVVDDKATDNSQARIVGTTLEYNSRTLSNVRGEVVNLQGRIIASQPMQLQPGMNRIELSTLFSSLSSGMYHLRVHGDAVSFTVAFMR